MNPWTLLVSGLQSVMTGAAGMLGVSLGVSILLVTFVVRAALVPITLPLAVKSRAWQATYRSIKPGIKKARETHRSDPRRSMKEVESQYADAGIAIWDKAGVGAAFIQLPILIAFFQAVLLLSEGSPLAEPSLLLGLAAGLFSVLSAGVGGAAQSKALLAVFAVLPVGIVLWLGAGIGYYLIGFYGASCIQAVRMRESSGDAPPEPTGEAPDEEA